MASMVLFLIILSVLFIYTLCNRTYRALLPLSLLPFINYVYFKAIEKWDGKLPANVLSGDNVPFVSVPK